MRASRLGDHIGHTFALEGLIGGAAVGAMAGAVLAVGVGGIVAALTAPLSVPLLIGAALIGGTLGGAALGASIGEFVGSLSAVSSLTSRGLTGEISSGSSDVFINNRKAARIGIDVVPCLKDPQVVALIAMGSSSVFLNDYPAARVDDKLSCGAIIKEGSEDVYIGGEQYKIMEVEEEVPGWMHWAVLGTGAAGALLCFGAAAIPVLGVGLAVAAAIPVLGGAFAVGYLGDQAFRRGGRFVGELLHNEFGFNVLPSEFENGGGLLGGIAGGWIGAKGGHRLWNNLERIELSRSTFGTNFGNVRIRKGPKHGESGGWTKEEIAELRKQNDWAGNWEGRSNPEAPKRSELPLPAENKIDYAHNVGVQGGREAALTLGYKPAPDWVNPFEFHGKYGKGYDDILIDSKGNYIIAEYKGGKSDLAPNQMERSWVTERIDAIRAAGHDEWANRLQQSLDSGTLRGIAFKTPIEENGAPGETSIIGAWGY
jgi:uncharacterized Zn-binding protein involved in type VI secretion